jgi:hypothetical protein
MQKHDGDAEAFRAVRLRPATSEDEAFLLNLFATTRSDELALMNWEENQKRAFIAMQFKAQSRQYVMRYPHAQNSIIFVQWSAGQANHRQTTRSHGRRRFACACQRERSA